MRIFSFIFLLYMSNFLVAQNIGVGTTNPSDALHVQGASNENALRVQVGNATKLRVLANGGLTVGQNNQSGTPENGLYVNGNTGLGASFPQEKLVVNGNIDVRGELKADGVSGEEGQYLTPDGNGNMVWENLSDCRFINMRQIEASGTFPFVVPTDVTLLKVELWGAGGSGNSAGGGGGGGYVCAFIETSPGENWTIEVGDSGSGTGDTKFFKTANPTSQTIARSGSDATAFAPGLGGTFFILNSTSGYGYRGESGTPTRIIYSQKSTTEFRESVHYGDGGASFGGYTAKGSFILKDANSGTKFQDYFGRFGNRGSGGFGDENIFNGADGYIVIRW